MTQFHDDVMDLDPQVFIPFDGPSDGGTAVYNHAGTGQLQQGVGGTIQAASGEVAFANELALDGTDDYWISNSTLLTEVRDTVFTGGTKFTAAVWWRTTLPISDVGPRHMMRLWQWGFNIRRSSGNIISSAYNEDSITESASFSTTGSSELGGGWQMAGLVWDSEDEGSLFQVQNGVRRVAHAIDSLDTIRWNGSTGFYVGSDESTSFWQGSIGPIALFDRALDPDDMMSLYQAGLGVPTVNEATDPQLRRPSGARCCVGATYMREP